jgi:chemotaxis protein MotA
MRSPAANRHLANLHQGFHMLRDLALAAKAACSREDQESLVPLVKDLRDLGEVAFKRGLLALEGELMQIKDPFLKLGIQLIVDKTEPENVQDILDADIYYNESNGRELLKKIIIREGLLRIQAGDNARNILICTKVFLGKADSSLW